MESIEFLDGNLFYNAVVSGGKKIIESQEEINKINVFPVPDGDTGSNMSFTMRQIIEDAHPKSSYAKTVKSIAEAALDGARGNSGTIFSQFFYGLSIYKKNHSQIGIEDFALACHDSIDLMYNAIGEPKNGTILSVAKDWADYIYKERNQFTNFIALFESSVEKAKQSLENTTNLLPVLKKTNVVDAGAQGFVYFLEGFTYFLVNQNYEDIAELTTNTELNSVNIKEGEFHEAENLSLDMITYSYCTEANIKARKGHPLSREKIYKAIKNCGDSIVIAGSPKKLRIHIHTDEPAKVFEILLPFGKLIYQKAENMMHQYQIIHERKHDIALVVDSGCDMPLDLMDKYQIHMIPLSISFGDNNYLDKLTIQPEQFYTMMRKSFKFPNTSQPSPKQYEGLFRFLANYYKSIICVTIAKNSSGTYNVAYQSAKRIQQEVDKKISVIDSENLSGGYGLLVNHIAESISSGMDHNAIVKQSEEWKKNIEFYMSFKTLKNLVAGGRISVGTGLIGTLLHLRPSIFIKEGRPIKFKNTLTRKQAIRNIENVYTKIKQEHLILDYMILHANDEEGAKIFAAEFEQFFGKPPLGIVSACPVLGAHAGEGALGVAILYE